MDSSSKLKNNWGNAWSLSSISQKLWSKDRGPKYIISFQFFIVFSNIATMGVGVIQNAKSWNYNEIFFLNRSQKSVSGGVCIVCQKWAKRCFWICSSSFRKKEFHVPLFQKICTQPITQVTCSFHSVVPHSPNYYSLAVALYCIRE